jgi:hypothetical protein
MSASLSIVQDSNCVETSGAKGFNAAPLFGFGMMHLVGKLQSTYTTYVIRSTSQTLFHCVYVVVVLPSNCCC